MLLCVFVITIYFFFVIVVSLKTIKFIVLLSTRNEKLRATTKLKKKVGIHECLQNYLFVLKILLKELFTKFKNTHSYNQSFVSKFQFEYCVDVFKTSQKRNKFKKYKL